MSEIPVGLCQCGCGRSTGLVDSTRVNRGEIRGQPRRFISGHHRRRPVLERFWAKVRMTDTCWIWTGARKDTGYGNFWYGDRMGRAHRFAYEFFVGPIPAGLGLDHLCRNRSCVNPDHLEPVTHQENVRRGVVGDYFRAKTHCPRGHEYTPENTYRQKSGSRVCRKCKNRVRDRERRHRRG